MEEETLFLHLKCLGIAESKRTISNMTRTIRKNIRGISKLFTPYLTGCQLGVVKLLYNCNVPATSPKTTSFLNKLKDHGLSRHSRQYSERLHKMSEDINTSHFRALEDFFRDPGPTITIEADTRWPLVSNGPDPLEQSLQSRKYSGTRTSLRVFLRFWSILRISRFKVPPTHLPIQSWISTDISLEEFCK
jgi:hypothetical protein